MTYPLDIDYIRREQKGVPSDADLKIWEYKAEVEDQRHPGKKKNTIFVRVFYKPCEPDHPDNFYGKKFHIFKNNPIGPELEEVTLDFNGIIHRDGNLAPVIYTTPFGYRSWYVNGQRSRIDGPAWIWVADQYEFIYKNEHFDNVKTVREFHNQMREKGFGADVDAFLATLDKTPEEFYQEKDELEDIE